MGGMQLGWRCPGAPEPLGALHASLGPPREKGRLCSFSKLPPRVSDSRDPCQLLEWPLLRGAGLIGEQRQRSVLLSLSVCLSLLLSFISEWFFGLCSWLRFSSISVTSCLGPSPKVPVCVFLTHAPLPPHPPLSLPLTPRFFSL